MGEFLTSLWPLGATILVILGAAVLIALIVVLVRVAKTMKNVNVITQEAEEKVTPALGKVDPLVDRVQLIVDTANLELLRVDGILEDVESVSDVAGKAADTVNNVTSAPTDAVTSVVERLRGKFSSRLKNKAKEERFVYPIGAKGGTGKHSADGARGAGASAAASGGAEEQAQGGPTYEELKQEAQTAAEKIVDDRPAGPAADAAAEGAEAE